MAGTYDRITVSPSLLIVPDTASDQNVVITATINLKPLPLKRCVATIRANGKIRLVQTHAREMETFRAAVRLQLRSFSLPVFEDNVPVSLGMTVFIRRPNYHFVGTKRNNEIKSSLVDCRVTGGDIDNFIKFVLDALNKTVYADDKQVCRVYCEKQWERDPESNGSTFFHVSKYVPQIWQQPQNGNFDINTDPQKIYKNSCM
jgi:Holliday junction resolvase RusA-like endonuclease